MGPAYQDLMPSGERDQAPDRVGPKLLQEALPGVMEGLRGLWSRVRRTERWMLPIREAIGAAARTVY